MSMPEEMVLIPAGEFRMGSQAFYPEEAPAHLARSADFLIDRHPVTNAQFRAFVEATGYVTVAERPLDASEYPQLGEAERAPGSLVFRPTDGPVDLRNWRAWWAWVHGADWRHPFGPDSDLAGREDHPVVQVCFTDAVAYAKWANKRLPTEVEWERAASGSHDGQPFAWGDELAPDGRLRANTWQGQFPYNNTGADGWRGTSPVGSFPPNDFGLVDVIGNVWEWTASRFTADHRDAAAAAADRTTQATASPTGCGCGCGPDSSRPAGGAAVSDAASGATAAEAALPASAPDPKVRRVTKGGSHLCAPEYCQRYRPAARSPQTEDSATTHLGFRCARDI